MKISGQRSTMVSGPERGQALTEFALVILGFMVVVGAIIQFGLVMWSQNAITEIARDTARWAVTQSTDPCDLVRPELANRANILADQAALIGYTSGTWSSAPAIASLGAEGIGADWQSPDSEFIVDCPPSDNQTVWTVRVRINHTVPIFMPFFELIAPSCSSSDWCISSETELRMEPKRP